MVMTKWGERPHWEFDGVLLGSDEHGDWIAFPSGTHMSRPGAEYVAPVDQVGLVPAPGEPGDRGWLATFHASGGVVHTYVDMTTPPRWDGAVLHAVDLDLDVIRLPDGSVGIDDEDEFEEHRARWSYPEDVVTLAVGSCERILAAVVEEAAPFDGTAATWLARVAPLPPAG